MNLNPTAGETFPFGIPGLLMAFFVLNVIIILVLAFAVANDAEQRKRNGPGLFLVGPWVWFSVVIAAGGYLPTLAYWLIHYSSLRYHPHKMLAPTASTAPSPSNSASPIVKPPPHE
jgi:hypothetical protein